jgi:hypothetical protein
MNCLFPQILFSHPYWSETEFLKFSLWYFHLNGLQDYLKKKIIWNTVNKMYYPPKVDESCH